MDKNSVFESGLTENESFRDLRKKMTAILTFILFGNLRAFVLAHASDISQVFTPTIIQPKMVDVTEITNSIPEQRKGAYGRYSASLTYRILKFHKGRFVQQ